MMFQVQESRIKGTDMSEKTSKDYRIKNMVVTLEYPVWLLKWTCDVFWNLLSRLSLADSFLRACSIQEYPGVSNKCRSLKKHPRSSRLDGETVKAWNKATNSKLWMQEIDMAAWPFVETKSALVAWRWYKPHGLLLLMGHWSLLHCFPNSLWGSGWKGKPNFNSYKATNAGRLCHQSEKNGLPIGRLIFTNQCGDTEPIHGTRTASGQDSTTSTKRWP